MLDRNVDVRVGLPGLPTESGTDLRSSPTERTTTCTESGKH